MGSSQEAEAAIRGLNGQNVGGRDLTVNIARPIATTLKIQWVKA